jgi:hypothetical protein
MNDAASAAPLERLRVDSSTCDYRIRTYPMPAERVYGLTLDDQDAVLLGEAVQALIAWHITSGVDKGDRLRNAAKALWERSQQEAR